MFEKDVDLCDRSLRPGDFVACDYRFRRDIAHKARDGGEHPMEKVIACHDDARYDINMSYNRRCGRSPDQRRLFDGMPIEGGRYRPWG